VESLEFGGLGDIAGGLFKMNRLNINNNGIEIDGILINEKIFNEELISWTAVDKETQIDHLIDWIGECGRDRGGDKYLMKEDLTTLIKKGNNGAEQTFFSSISTNEYVFWDEGRFDEICDEILKLNEGLK